MYLNKALLYGNLTRDPELKNTTGGALVASFSIATNRSYTKDGEKKEQTEFHNIIAFGKIAEVMGKYLKKGNPVYVEGRLQTRSWDKDGTKQYRTEIIIDNFQFGPRTEPTTNHKKPDADLEKEFERPDRSMQPDKEYAPAITPPGGYPDEKINPEDIPF